MSFLLNPFISGSGGGGGGGGGALSSFSGDLATRPWATVATWPSIIHSGGKTYVGHIAETPPQTAKITVYDHSAGTRETYAIDTQPLQDDDHGAVALCLLSDGRIAAFYGSHNNNQEWSISGESGGVPDVSTWTRQTAIAGSYTYPKPVNIDSGAGAGTLWLVMRRRDSSTDYPLVIRSASYTSGGSLSFSADTEIIELSGRVYASEVRADASDNIEIVATRSDGGDTLRQHVYYFKYVTADGSVENLGGGTSTASGSLPVDKTAADANYREVDSGSNHTGLVSWCRDADGALHILYGDDTDGSATFSVKHNVHSGGAWGTAAEAFTVKDKNSGGGFVEGWCIVPLDTGDNVEVWYPTGDTGSWSSRGGDSMARKIYASGSFGAEEIIHTGTNSRALAHPTPVFNAHVDFRVAFCEVTQSITGTDAVALERYGYGDNGFVQWPDLTDSNLYQVALLLGFNGSDGAAATEDESHWAHLHPVTFNGNAQLDTAQKKFGTASLLLDGTGDYLTVPRSRTDITQGAEWKKSGDTIEGWFRLNATGKQQTIIGTRESGQATGLHIQVESSDVLRLLVWDGSGLSISITGTTTLVADQWYYFAAQRNGSDYELRLDNGSEGTASSAAAPDEGGTLYIGNSAHSGAVFDGWLDEIRWTKRILRDVSSAPASAFPRS